MSFVVSSAVDDGSRAPNAVVWIHNELSTHQSRHSCGGGQIGRPDTYTHSSHKRTSGRAGSKQDTHSSLRNEGAPMSKPCLFFCVRSWVWYEVNVERGRSRGEDT